MPTRRKPILGFILFAAMLVIAMPPDWTRAQTAPHHPGLWTSATPWAGRDSFAVSVHAVHMALLRGDTLFARPHSQVLAWGNWSETAPAGGGLWGWRSSTDLASQAGSNLTPLAVATPPYDLFCAGHAALPDGDLLVVSGTERGKTGALQSARFDFLSRQWSLSTMNGRRWYGNATSLPDGKLLATAGNAGHHVICFGGLSKNGSESAVLNSDVRRYHITNLGEWDAALTDPGGVPWPTPRQFPTMTDKATTQNQAGGPYYVFGGKSGGGGTLRDIWQLRLRDNDIAESYEWRQISPNNPTALPTRWRHAAFVVPRYPDTLATMYVHGGESFDGPQPVDLNDLWRLSWRTDLNPVGWYWANRTGEAVGDIPPGPRSGHSIFWDRPNNRAVLYGGRVNGAIDDPNVYVLTFQGTGSVPTWNRPVLRPGSALPAARTRHAMAWNPKVSTGLVFGGETATGLSSELLELSLNATGDTVAWYSRPANGSTAPAARADATIIGYEEYPTSYVVIGGELQGGAWDANTYEFRFDDRKWRTLTPASPALRGHRAIIENRILTPLQPELFDPVSNTWTQFGQPKKRQSYHTMFAASDGMLYSCGPNPVDTDTTFQFNPTSGVWSVFNIANGSTALDATVSGVLYRPNKILKVGDSDINATTHEYRSASVSMQIDETVPQWRQPVVAMGRGRMDHTVSMLPTGDAIVTGGHGVNDNDNVIADDDAPRTRPEIWDPNVASGGNVGSWYWGTSSGDSLAAEPVTRGHHSSAVTLPDGRILSGGGWDPHPSAVKRSVDQYSPPYLFTEGGGPATRPALLGAQDHIPYAADTFQVACPDPIVEACLIRPGASTHAFNHDARYIPLTIYRQLGHKVTLQCAGWSSAMAPPGNYLLFVLRSDGGRKVPSVARWVNVGSSLPTYATWDIQPPATIGNLSIIDVTAGAHTLQWSAPADAGDGSSGKATRYELRYRAGGSMGSSEDFFEHGRRVDPVQLPAPGVANTTQTVTVTGLSPDTTYFFRIISRDGAGSDRNWSALSNEVQTPSGSGGCPFVDTRTAGGWQVENSILGRSLTGTLSLDGYRLRHAPEVVEDRVHLRIRENEQELTTLDQVRLIAVDHAPGVRAFAVGEEVVLGIPAPTSHATTSAGADVTSLFSGTNDGFQGGPGDTVVVEFEHEAAAVIGEERGTTSHDPFHIDDGGKCPPDCGYPLKSPTDPYSATGIDAQVLSGSGIQIQSADGLGGWRTVLTRYPREHQDEAVFEEVSHGPVRLVFVGRHTVRSVGRLETAGGSFTARKLPLLAAQHTRFGDVTTMVDTTGNLTSQLAPGDTVKLEFGWVPVPEGQVRELFLLSRGVYTANLPAKLQEAPPTRFAARPMRPNPFAGTTTLWFDLPDAESVQLEVLDAQGRRVRMMKRQFPTGSHSIEWDGRNEAGGRVGPGVYFYRLNAGGHHATGRITRLP